MARPKKYGARTPVTILFEVDTLAAADEAVNEKKICSRNELVNQAVKLFSSKEEGGTLAGLERVKAQLTEGYCMNHKIAKISGNIISLDPHKNVHTLEQDIHIKTLDWLESIDFT